MKILTNYNLTTLEGNILLAKHMGWKIDNSFPDKERVYRSPENNIELDTTLKFHSSWDLLMPVWNNILDLTKLVLVNRRSKKNAIIYNGLVKRYFKAVSRNRPEEGFIEVTKAIIWYNYLNR